MLSRLTAVIDIIDGNQATAVPVGPLGQAIAYELLLPAYLAQRLLTRTRHDEPVTLYTIQYLESVNQGASFIPRLMGFASAQERDFFELLTSVKGLGNKRALRALAIEPSIIARAIAERDARALQRLPEIGPKLAELIVHELKSKADPFLNMPTALAGGGAPAPTAPITTVELKDAAPATGRPARGKKDAPTRADTEPRPPIRQTVDALIALGETPADAERLVSIALERAKAAGEALPLTTQDLLTAAYAARRS